MLYIQLGLVVLACMYAVPLVVTLMQDGMAEDGLRTFE